jgi:hypothetical protein
MCIIFEVEIIKGRNGHKFLVLDLPYQQEHCSTGKINSVAVAPMNGMCRNLINVKICIIIFMKKLV